MKKEPMEFTHYQSAAGEARYHYVECGLDNVWLVNGFEREDFEGEIFTRVLDTDLLHRSIAHGLAKHAAKLEGQAVRFIRKELDITQGNLSLMLGVTAQTVARWEKGEVEIPRAAELIIRALMLTQLEGNVDVCELVKTLSEADEPVRQQFLKLTHEATGWRSQPVLEDA
jgi:DNA-binding transcriptional regulator YiaG